ncbi:hypothetical protein [Peristeroidobacter agariperforans]|uniref:hypothetical protein n=1 Tax=Peristeroidobacter agariperforans TaxID=268404 RepID=UPI00101DBE6D|nr:hypothetical protein [Peristeroidobacter agariperforans]
MEAALRAGEERFRLLYEAQHTAHVVLSPNLTIEAVSEQYFDLRKARGSLGIRVITSLAAQLKGTLTVHSAPPGTRFVVEFPIKAAAPMA